VDQLQTGIFVCLEEHWLKHPFLLNNFKIKTEKQLAILKQLGITEFKYDPDRSDRPPLPAQTRPHKAQVVPTPRDIEMDKEFQRKQERKKRLLEIRGRIAKTARKFSQTADKVPNLMSKLMAGKGEGLAEVDLVVGEMVDTFLALSDTVMHLMSANDKELELTYHFLNVSVLSLMLGSALNLSREELQALGAGALMHDLGKMRIEKKHWRKPRETMTKHEWELLQLHPRYGMEMACQNGARNKDILTIIGQHHERIDGGGYPEGLGGRQLHLFAKITTIANIFDNLCNHYDPEKRLSPHAALQLMFKKYDMIIDMGLFSQFVRRLGVFPPGTIVLLSNNVVAKVMAVNPSNPLTPMVLPYVNGVSPEDAVVLDLTREDLRIKRTLAVADLSSSQVRYLKPKSRISYFMEDMDAESQG
jgi:HD-GYP domain-containing protein (c-di-GMP phosphodiesterase class II)